MIRSSEDHSAVLHQPIKRRKVRKGTQSCWQCKRRKIKCTFASSKTSECDGCKSRQVACIGQDVVEPIGLESNANVDHTKHRFRQVIDEINAEELVPQLSLGHGATSKLANSHDHDRNNRSSRVSSPELAIARHSATTLGSHDYAGLGSSLISIWPCERDMDIICKTYTGNAVLFHGTVCLPYATIFSQEMEPVRDTLRLPPVGSHPIFIAQKLLLLASFIQGIPRGLVKGLSQLRIASRELSNQLVRTASKLVTSDDSLVASLEGIECIMMESMYYNNAGDLRQAWLTNRRALVIAQMLGLHLGRVSSQHVLDEQTRERIEPSCMWFRVVTSDRYLSLMLALPQGSNKSPFATPEALKTCIPLERMERIISTVASDIIERDQDDWCDLESTLRMDKLLQDGAESMSAQWWMIPEVSKLAGSGTDALKDSMRMVTQFAHFYLVAQLHLPFILMPSSDSSYEYSRLTALNSSREILARFLTLRGSIMFPVYCRGIDFLAFIASTILCVAHIDVHKQDSTRHPGSIRPPHYLRPQRLSDRGLMESTLRIMETVVGDDNNLYARRIASIMKRLLIIEKAAAGGSNFRATFSPGDSGNQFHQEDPSGHADRSVSIDIPHYGTVKIEETTPNTILDDHHSTSTAGPSTSTSHTSNLSNNNLRPSQQPLSMPTDLELLTSEHFQCDWDSLLDCEQTLTPDEGGLHGVDMALFNGLFYNWKC